MRLFTRALGSSGPRQEGVRARWLLLLCPLALATAAGAQTLSRGPFIQNPDALTSTMTIEWWTNVAGDSTVEYGTTPGLGSTRTEPQAGSCEIGSAGTCHIVQLTGLSPGTRYYYRLLTNGVEVQSTTYFTTLKDPTDTSELFFTAMGDWGQATGAETSIANLQDAADPQMIITVGDNAYSSGSQSNWDNNALAYYRTPMQRIPFFPTLGNHDLASAGVSNWANSVEIKMFLLPRNGTEVERYFSFDSGDAHFIVLDANSPTNTVQKAWLASDLAATTRTWKFAFLHQTPYSCASGLFSIGSDLNVRNNWGPLFEQYGVDIVFDGHDHIYERTTYMDDYLVGGAGGSDGLGTTYVMTGGGGATLDGAAQLSGGVPKRGSTTCYWLATGCAGGPGGYCSFARYHYVSVRITNNDTLTMQAIDNGGSVFDTLIINKAVTTPTPSPTATDTPTPETPFTPTETPTATPTSCAGDAPLVDPVTSPDTSLLQTITGYSSHPLSDIGGSHTLYVSGPGGLVYAHSLGGGLWAADMPLAPNQLNSLTVCLTSFTCPFTPCTSDDRDSNPLDILQIPAPTDTPTPVVSPTPTPTVPPDCQAGIPSNACIPGGGARSRDCALEWLSESAPTYLVNGMRRNYVICPEGYAGCDADPDPDNHSCTFRITLCINNSDPRLGCTPSNLDSFEVRKPRQFSLDPVDLANRAALESAAGAGGFGVTVVRSPLVVGQPNPTLNLCGQPFDIVVPLKAFGNGSYGVGRKILRTRVRDMSGAMDRDRLRLECRPGL